MLGIEQSLLYKALKKKSGTSTFRDGLLNIFNAFSRMVSEELKQINRLFDEYTPHDDTHMRSLFRLADELLGKNTIHSLNGVELCILACAMYGHDWGMAVSEDEKREIVTGATTEHSVSAHYGLLGDERQRWKSFAKGQGISAHPDGLVQRCEDVPLELWREYVRQTHAERAKFRIVAHFKRQGDPAPLGPPLGEVCAGHWYDITRIQKLDKQWSIGGMRVNIQALAIYTRFIDLLDIGNNRTPWALRVFINPSDPRSSVEWRKHQAINPVTIDAHESGRSLRKLSIHGHTDNHIVYAALEDLRRYCEAQVKENCSALHDLTPSYQIGQIELDWSVRAEGFEPIDVRFEFDRDRMFSIVAGEIYDGDPYVFIRELLQNAIDAILLRKKRYEHGMDCLTTPTILVNVQHGENGDAVVSVEDCGTGMTLPIIKNYLATVGRSYYRSGEFDSQSTGMRPISRFGLGLMSCFEVADSIFIETESDRILGDGVRYRIEIPDRRQQFHIQKLPSHGKPGSVLQVNVKGAKWRKGTFQDQQHLSVTEYIKAIAGFVAFPIVIRELGKETVVISATSRPEDMEAICKRFPNAEIHRESLDYEISDTVEPQDIDTAEQFLEQVSIRLGDKVGGISMEGSLAYCHPTPDVLASVRRTSSREAGAGLLVHQNDQTHTLSVRWNNENHPRWKSGISPSSSRFHFYRVYFRGILVPEVEIKIEGGSCSPRPRVRINLDCDDNELIPTLSRMGLKGGLDEIRRSIQERLGTDASERLLQPFHNATPIDRLLIIARTATYWCPSRFLLDVFPVESWPVVVVDRSGTLTISKFNELPTIVDVAPRYLLQKQRELEGAAKVANHLRTMRISGAEGIVSQEQTMILRWFGFEYNDGSPQEWNEIDACLSVPVVACYSVVRARLGHTTDHELPYIIFEWERHATKSTINYKQGVFLAGISFHFDFVSFGNTCSELLCALPVEWDEWREMHNIMYKVVFNTDNPVARILNMALIEVDNRGGGLAPLAAGHLRDALRQCPVVGGGYTGIHQGIVDSMPRWAAEFCFKVADLGIVVLTEAQRESLRQPARALAVRE